MRILINECYNIARRINVNEPLDEGYAENMKQPKENRDYSELYRAVNELKEELRIPVILYYMEEFNIREIAQILEISEGAVQKRLVRARKTLKKRRFLATVVFDYTYYPTYIKRTILANYLKFSTFITLEKQSHKFML